ncbi:MAG: EF-P lysine aminoacylase GenX [Thiohalocapsa sp.]|uniref:EF-P lysine aminoacylase EpmA n=1 Tax=Thiohalocapsa sp. TaxID=2497641 RepID=UPI0025CC6D95|nr:EF-P lysine aminoacylase EpmA [Thiohalocapsa sp.]MCG6940348.1 EF-P lysine aminoacylase GenX [Thiohalocapsa sp.]
MADHWRPRASLAAVRARARLLAGLRGFFAERCVLEVETPILSAAANPDPAIEPLHLDADLTGAGPGRWYLQTSPELPMKRLLAAGSGPIYQVCKVFRADERGRRHHPEFTMLEWYRPGFSLDDLMDEMAALVRCLAADAGLAEERITYRDLFRDRLGVDPSSSQLQTLQSTAVEQGIASARALDLDRDGWLDLLLSHCLEPHLGQGGLTFLHDYPPSQAALARIVPGERPVARRFELYWRGMELANGFDELADADQQRLRFEQDLAVRAGRGQAPLPPDGHLLAALGHGLPACSGVALGLDRLLLCLCGHDHIDQVLAFPVERA